MPIVLGRAAHRISTDPERPRQRISDVRSPHSPPSNIRSPRTISDGSRKSSADNFEPSPDFLSPSPPSQPINEESVPLPAHHGRGSLSPFNEESAAPHNRPSPADDERDNAFRPDEEDDFVHVDEFDSPPPLKTSKKRK